MAKESWQQGVQSTLKGSGLSVGRGQGWGVRVLLLLCKKLDFKPFCLALFKKTWRDGVGREVGKGVQDGGDTCIPMADSHCCMAKTTTIL